ncbi:hypothetical protein ACFV0D_35305, partial [Streptomyces sp. NPDC059556]
ARHAVLLSRPCPPRAGLGALPALPTHTVPGVARGAAPPADGNNDKYEAEYTSSTGTLTEALAAARELADDDAGRDPVDEAASRTAEWKQRHKDARAKDEAGDFEGALGRIVGSGESTGRSFDQVDAALDRALAHEQTEFTRSAGDARDALTALPLGALALGILGAAGAVLGINRRLSEYR